MDRGGFTRALATVGLTATSGVGFTDELRVGRRGTTRRVWGRRGVKVRPRLQLRYAWRDRVLAVDGRAGMIWWGRATTMKAVDRWPLVAGLRAMDVLDALGWDRAPSQRDADVRAIGLPLIELPPSSPELNPAERLFEEIRRRVEGQLSPTLDAKVAEVAAFLTELDADPARVRRLAGWDWIETTFQPLPAPAKKAA